VLQTFGKFLQSRNDCSLNNSFKLLTGLKYTDLNKKLKAVLMYGIKNVMVVVC